MNSLPTTFDPMEWAMQFKDALLELLVDVDRVAVFANACYRFPDPAAFTANTSVKGLYSLIMMVSQDRQSHRTNVDIDVDPNVPYGTHQMIESHLRQLQRSGMPFDEYQNPVSFIYEFNNTEEHLGIIFLFRKRDMPPISTKTLETMEQLRPFFFFVLSDFASRYRYTRPEAIIFNGIISHLFRKLTVTSREREVLTLRLLGFQVSDIARKLYVTPNAIKRHIKSIHRKAGVDSFMELFMRHLTTEIDMESLFANLQTEYNKWKKEQQAGGGAKE